MVKSKLIRNNLNLINYIIVFSLLFASINVITPVQTSAKTIDCNDPRLSMNDIQFWNPCESECPDVSVSGDGGFTAEMGRNERLRQVVSQYGEHAMDMQRKYGTPWELVFAQMVMESGVGTAGIAVNGATNNWLGIKGTGDAGTTGRDAIYSSIEASISDWAGPRVLRNGLYDAAFKYTDPNSYDIKQFFAVMIEVYAPTSDGNDTGEYKSVIYGLLEGDIKDVREEKGWPSSAELAKKENIPIGGTVPIGQSADANPSGQDANSSSRGDCVSETTGFDLDGMVYFDQCDPRWSNEPYGIGRMCTCACGPTSMSMIIATLNKDSTISPPGIAKEYYEAGGQSGDCGSNWAWDLIFSKYNLQTTDIGKDMNKAKETINNGGLVLFSWNGTPYTTGGHIMVIRGFTSDGNVLVASSGGETNKTHSQVPWNINIFKNGWSSQYQPEGVKIHVGSGPGLRGMWAVTK